MTEVRLPPLFGAVNTAAVDIAATRERVWAVLFHRAAWVPKFLSKTPLDGPQDAAGERARYTSADDAGAPQTRIEEILLSAPPERLVARLALADNDATFAFAEWRIASKGEGCRLEMSLFWTDLPEEGADWPATRRLRDGYVAHTQGIIATLVANIARAAEGSSGA